MSFWLFLFTFANVFSIEPTRWVVDYSQGINPKQLRDYSVIVMDSQGNPLLEGFIEKEKEVLGYISLMEVGNHRWYFPEIEQAGLVIEENPNWPGTYVIDIRNKQWVKMVIEQLIPRLLFERYDGLFLDNLDDAAALEQRNPEKYAGMKKAAVNLVKAIHLHYPEAILMMNRAYELLPQLADQINIELGESVYSTYDFTTKSYKHVPEEEYQRQVELLKKAQQANPQLRVFTLDYWNPDDSDEIRKIYQVERNNGFVPYVSTIDLQKVIPEPK